MSPLLQAIFYFYTLTLTLTLTLTCFSASMSPHGNRSLLTEMEISDSEKSLNGSRR